MYFMSQAPSLLATFKSRPESLCPLTVRKAERTLSMDESQALRTKKLKWKQDLIQFYLFVPIAQFVLMQAALMKT